MFPNAFQVQEEKHNASNTKLQNVGFPEDDQFGQYRERAQSIPVHGLIDGLLVCFIDLL